MGNIAEKYDHDIALAVLEPYFDAAREVYLEFAKERDLNVRGLKKLRLECRPDMHDTPRHFAGAAQDGSKIALAPQMIDLPEDTVAAIIAHEFGHIVDFLNPGQFFCDEDEEKLIYMPDEEGERGDRTRLARMRQWDQRSEHAIELTADLIAKEAIGKRIGYSGPCLLQGFARGVSRPRELR